MTLCLTSSYQQYLYTLELEPTAELVEKQQRWREYNPKKVIFFNWDVGSGIREQMERSSGLSLYYLLLLASEPDIVKVLETGYQLEVTGDVYQFLENYKYYYYTPNYRCYHSEVWDKSDVEERESEFAIITAIKYNLFQDFKELLPRIQHLFNDETFRNAEAPDHQTICIVRALAEYGRHEMYKLIGWGYFDNFYHDYLSEYGQVEILTELNVEIEIPFDVIFKTNNLALLEYVDQDKIEHPQILVRAMKKGCTFEMLTSLYMKLKSHKFSMIELVLRGCVDFERLDFFAHLLKERVYTCQNTDSIFDYCIKRRSLLFIRYLFEQRKIAKNWWTAAKILKKGNLCLVSILRHEIEVYRMDINRIFLEITDIDVANYLISEGLISEKNQIRYRIRHAAKYPILESDE